MPATPPPAPASATPDPTGRPARQVLARRVLGFDEAVHNRVVDRQERVGFGVVRVTPSLPMVYSLSSIQVDRPAAVPEVLAVADETLAGLPNTSVWTTQAEVAWSLGPGLADDGFALQRVMYMVHDGRTAPRVSPLGFEEVDVERAAAHRRAAVAEEAWGGHEDVQAQFAEREQRLAERLDATFVLSTDGAAGCHVYRHGAIAQIESVAVLAEARGRGLGSGLMAAAMRACEGADTTFLIADADGWPRHWYSRLGFVPVASGWEWNRPR